MTWVTKNVSLYPQLLNVQKYYAKFKTLTLVVFNTLIKYQFLKLKQNDLK